MAVRTIILDVDGTLVNSNDAHAHSWVEALAEHGYSVPFDRVRRLIGMGSDKVLQETTGLEKETGPGKAISNRSGAIFRERYLPSIRPFPHVRALLMRMRDRGLRRVVATSGKREDLDTLLRIAGVDELIDAATAGDVRNTKPDPDLVQEALQQAGSDPRETLMIGDTPYDIQAAQRAGVPIVAFRCGGWEDADLGGAVAVYQDPADLLLRFDDSPLAANRAGEAGPVRGAAD